MEDKAKCIEVRTNDGKVLFSFFVFDKVIGANTKSNNSTQETKGSKGQGNNNHSNGNLMTDAQKRYLFRILADNGIEEDKAYDELKNLFHVNTLKEVSKMEACQMIDNLLKENKGGEDNDKSPIK